MLTLQMAFGLGSSQDESDKDKTRSEHSFDRVFDFYIGIIICNSEFVYESPCINKAHLGNDRHAGNGVIDNYTGNIILVIFLYFCCQWNNKYHIFVEFFEYQHRPLEFFSFAVLFKSNIRPESSPPDLFLTKEYVVYVFSFVKDFLFLVTFAIFFFHQIQTTPL